MAAWVLVATYVVVVLAPLAIAALGGMSPQDWRDALASAFGLVALAIIMVAFVLSGRFRIVSARIGMDRTMRAHQLLAGMALVLLAVHPFLYAAPGRSLAPGSTCRQSAGRFPSRGRGATPAGPAAR
jgi:predicted ferric reductase